MYTFQMIICTTLKIKSYISMTGRNFDRSGSSLHDGESFFAARSLAVPPGRVLLTRIATAGSLTKSVGFADNSKRKPREGTMAIFWK